MQPAEIKKKVFQLQMVKEFQCPGCTCGSEPSTCRSANVKEVENSFFCSNHHPGTSINFIPVALGLPIGFNRIGKYNFGSGYVRLHEEGNYPEWDEFNVPVWAMEKDGYLFVRTYCPRNNWLYVDVIPNGKLSKCPNAINAGNLAME